MRKLLSKAQQRQVAIFEYLVQYHWVHLQTLSEELNFAQRTIVSDIAEINRLAFPIEIQSSPRGVKLNFPVNYSARYFYRKILEESREFQIIEMVFYEEVVTLDELAEALFLSLSTLKRLLSQINLQLKSRHFAIKTLPLQLVGDEAEIVHFMTFYFMEKYYYQALLFSKDEKCLLEKLTHHVLDKLQLKANHPSFKRTNYWTYTHLMRLKNQHTFPIKADLPEIQWPILQDQVFLTEFSATFDLELSEQVINQSYIRFLDPTYAYNTQELPQIFQTRPELKQIYEKLQQLLRRLEEEFQIPNQHRSKLQLSLFRLVTQRHSPAYILYPRRKYFLLGISGNYRVITKLLRKRLNEIFQNQWHDYELDELIYTLFTHWPELVPSVRNFLPEVPVGIYLDTDVEHAELLKNELIRRSHLHLAVTIIDDLSTENFEILQQNETILITNLPQLPLPHPYVVCIAEMPAEWQWEKIQRLENDYVERRIALI